MPGAVGVHVKNTLKQSDGDTLPGTKLVLFIIAVLNFCIYPYHSNHCNYEHVKVYADLTVCLEIACSPGLHHEHKWALLCTV